MMVADPHRTADLPNVLPGYFETLPSRILADRTFTEEDKAGSRALAAIDDRLAAKAFPQRTAVGQRLCVYIPGPTSLETIGVVEHQHLHSLGAPGADQIYMLDGFWGIGISRPWALRTHGEPANYAGAVRAELIRLAPGRLAVTEMQTMETIVRRAQAPTRFQLLLMGLCAAMAATLACVGLYGVVSSAVGQRPGEIGIRMALGAAPGAIFRLVIGQGLAFSGAGIAGGLAPAAGLTRAMTSMLIGVKPADPATLAAMTVLFLCGERDGLLGTGAAGGASRAYSGIAGGIGGG
jgi:putative ABC transport system permease protein